MELSVNGILAAIDDFLTEAGAHEYRAHSGLEPLRSRAEALSSLREVVHPDTIAFVRELSTSGRIDSVRKSRLDRLLARLLELAGHRCVAENDDEIAALLRTRTFVAAGKTWTLLEALREGWNAPTVETRALIATERSQVFWDEQAPFAHRVDALSTLGAGLGLQSAAGLVEAIQRRTFEAVLPRAEEFLRATDDAARDLCGYALKKVDGTVKTGSARHIDLERALAAPWFFELLRKEDLFHAVARMFGDLGMHPSANGRLLVDTDLRPGRTTPAVLVPVEVPDELRLVLTAAPGFDAWDGWLGAWGEGQFHAAIPRTLPFIDRVIGDGALALAVRRVYESVLLDEGWLKRAVKVTSPQARELARTFAWRQVMEIRLEAASLSVLRDVLSRGPVRSVADGFVSAMERAAFVQPEKGRFLHELDLFGTTLTSLDAWALEAIVVHELRERFNEDWWRNPAAGRFLSGLAGRGLAEDAGQLASSLGRPKLELTDASRRRIVVMGA